MLLAYLAVLGVGVFGPEPGAELDAAAGRLRDLEHEVRQRVGGSSSTTGDPAATSTTTPPAEAPRAAEPRAEGDDEWFADLRAEPFFNVVVFVPLGLLLPIAVPQLRWLTPLLGAQLSGTVELVQDVLLDHRSPTVEDVRWNSLGAALGFALWLALRVFTPLFRPRRVATDR